MHAFQSNFLPVSALAGEGACYGWRWAGLSCAKRADEDSQPLNDDTWLVRHDHARLDLALVDVATQKRGITGQQLQTTIATAFTEAGTHDSPAEILAAAHHRLLDQLSAAEARGAACLMVVRLAADGSCLWAHAGDAVLIHWQAPSKWRGSRVRLLNNRHRQGHGLTHGVGIQRPSGVQFEEGMLALDNGDRLLMMSDGVYHDAMTPETIQHWVDAHEQVIDTRLPADLVRKIEAEARFSQPRPDDSTLVVIERRQVVSGEHHAA